MAGSATVAQSGTGSGSSTFNIERRTAIASDAKEHKVCIGTFFEKEGKQMPVKRNN